MTLIHHSHSLHHCFASMLKRILPVQGSDTTMFNSSTAAGYIKMIFFAGSKLDELDKTIKVGAVSYLNTKPLMYAFRHGLKIHGMEIVEEYPAKVAAMLLNHEIDVGLVPVAIIPKLKEYY